MGIFSLFTEKSIKQVIVMRTDLNMGKGKIAAQASHASLEAYKKTKSKNPEIVNRWEQQGMEKVVLKVNSEKELLEIFENVKKEIPCALITDAGKTQLESGTKTCLGIGPWDEKIIDKFTGKLKLL